MHTRMIMTRRMVKRTESGVSYRPRMAASSTWGGRRVSSSSGGSVTGSMPQKSSLIVSGEALMLFCWSSWNKSFSGMISSNSTLETRKR